MARHILIFLISMRMPAPILFYVQRTQTNPLNLLREKVMIAMGDDTMKEASRIILRLLQGNHKRLVTF